MAEEDPREARLREALRAAAEEAVPDEADRLQEALAAVARRSGPRARLGHVGPKSLRWSGKG